MIYDFVLYTQISPKNSIIFPSRFKTYTDLLGLLLSFQSRLSLFSSRFPCRAQVSHEQTSSCRIFFLSCNNRVFTALRNFLLYKEPKIVIVISFKMTFTIIMLSVFTTTILIWLTIVIHDINANLSSDEHRALAMRRTFLLTRDVHSESFKFHCYPKVPKENRESSTTLVRLKVKQAKYRFWSWFLGSSETITDEWDVLILRTYWKSLHEQFKLQFSSKSVPASVTDLLSACSEHYIKTCVQLDLAGCIAKTFKGWVLYKFL